MTTIDLISECVHCGFCLPACPTYRSWGLEADSPRGRIDLMKGLEEGTIALDESVVAHFDQCLGCMACLTACPSGVRYDLLIESTRAKVEAQAPRSLFERLLRAMIFAIFPHPARLLRLAPFTNLMTKLGLQGAVPGGALLQRIDIKAASIPLPERTAAQGAARARVGLVAGCVQRVMFPQVNAATVRVLSAEGCDVIVPAEAGCCGALSLHTGRSQEAKAFARALIAQFEAARVDAVIVNVAGCGSAMKQYGELFAGDAQWAERAQAFSDKVRDISEFLADIEPRARRNPIDATVAYHDACHLAHAQRVRQEPRDVLCGIPGLKLVEIPDGDQCCGSAGTYNLLEPASAREIGLRKVANVLATGAPIVASGNPGCTLQMQSLLRERGANVRIVHPIELLDESILGS
ncbi:MAG TPA: heterodisulfide reductase-related iron-sulfur binding cluster [Verrucomicrobiae bacterium]|nr:heterodisulfide reductase-related iron-sulfur binding cluster [Verrucomicrobiae bacterium]